MQDYDKVLSLPLDGRLRILHAYDDDQEFHLVKYCETGMELCSVSFFDIVTKFRIFDSYKFSQCDLYFSLLLSVGSKKIQSFRVRSLQQMLLTANIPVVRVSEIRLAISSGFDLTWSSIMQFEFPSEATTLYSLSCLQTVDSQLLGVPLPLSPPRQFGGPVTAAGETFMDLSLSLQFAGIIVRNTTDCDAVAKHLKIPILNMNTVARLFRSGTSALDWAQQSGRVELTLQLTRDAFARPAVHSDCTDTVSNVGSTMRRYFVSLAWFLSWTTSSQFQKNRSITCINTSARESPVVIAQINISSPQLLLSMCTVIDSICHRHKLDVETETIPFSAFSSTAGDQLDFPPETHVLSRELLLAAHTLNCAWLAHELGSTGNNQWYHEQLRRSNLTELLRAPAHTVTTSCSFQLSAYLTTLPQIDFSSFPTQDTLRAPHRLEYDLQALENPTTFINRFHATTKNLTLRLLRSGNFVVAGGAVLASMLLDPEADNPFAASDIDVFPIGSRYCDAQLEKVHRSIQKVLPGTEYLCVQTSYAVTFCLPAGYPDIQVILRSSETAEHVLQNFDLDCVCIAISKNSITFLPRFLHAIEARTNVFDDKFSAAPYYSRLRKYRERGFSIVIPGLSECTWGGASGSYLARLKGCNTDAYYQSNDHPADNVNVLSSNYEDSDLATIDDAHDGGRSMTTSHKWLYRALEKIARVADSLGMDSRRAYARSGPYADALQKKLSRTIYPFLSFPNPKEDVVFCSTLISEYLDAIWDFASKTDFKLSPRHQAAKKILYCEDVNTYFRPAYYKNGYGCLPKNEGRFRGVDPRDDWFLEYQRPSGGSSALTTVGTFVLEKSGLFTRSSFGNDTQLHRNLRHLSNVTVLKRGANLVSKLFSALQILQEQVDDLAEECTPEGQDAEMASSLADDIFVEVTSAMQTTDAAVSAYRFSIDEVFTACSPDPHDIGVGIVQECILQRDTKRRCAMEHVTQLLHTVSASKQILLGTLEDCHKAERSIVSLLTVMELQQIAELFQQSSGKGKPCSVAAFDDDVTESIATWLSAAESMPSAALDPTAMLNMASVALATPSGVVSTNELVHRIPVIMWSLVEVLRGTFEALCQPSMRSHVDARINALENEHQRYESVLRHLSEEDTGGKKLVDLLAQLKRCKHNAMTAKKSLMAKKIEVEFGVVCESEPIIPQLESQFRIQNGELLCVKQNLLKLSVHHPEVFLKVPELRVLGMATAHIRHLVRLANVSQDYEELEVLSVTQFHRIIKVKEQDGDDGTLVLKEYYAVDQNPFGFQRVVQALTQTAHRFVVPLKAVLVDTVRGPLGRRWFLQFPFCHDGTLRTWMQNESNTTSPTQCIQMLRKILLGLQHLHSCGVVHRDVSALTH